MPKRAPLHEENGSFLRCVRLGPTTSFFDFDHHGLIFFLLIIALFFNQHLGPQNHREHHHYSDATPLPIDPNLFRELFHRIFPISLSC